MFGYQLMYCITLVFIWLHHLNFLCLLARISVQIPTFYPSASNCFFKTNCISPAVSKVYAAQTLRGNVSVWEYLEKISPLFNTTQKFAGDPCHWRQRRFEVFVMQFKRKIMYENNKLCWSYYSYTVDRICSQCSRSGDEVKFLLGLDWPISVWTPW